ncbi:uncharacterized protein LOC116941277 [Petromyzon marinus]|uniref:uncharacterized protein LOC116941277 n=1 Tax=Petromyzon marinus TaxID=7757 RepID=UPI003F701B74
MALSDQSQVWFPTHVQVTVIQARSLRIKGKQGLNDAYTLIQLGKEKYSTSVAEKTLCPRWQEDCTFEVPADASSAKKSTLVLTVMHRALVGGDKFLGQVTLPLRDIYQDSTRKKTQWYKLESKPGKKEKERGELEVNIQYMRNNLTASMFDLSLKDKKRTPFGKLRDKVSGKKKEGSKGGYESSSAVVSSSAAMDSDEEGHAPDVEQKKKKTKTLTLFSKSSMQKGSVSQSMLTLPTSKGLGSLASLSPFRHHGRRESSGTASVNSDSDSVGGSNPNLADSPDGSPGPSKSNTEPHPSNTAGLSTSPLASAEVQSTHRRHVSLTGIEEEEGNREGLPGKSKKSTSSGGSNPFGSDDLRDANPFSDKKGADDPEHKNPFQEKSPPSGSVSSAPAKKSEEKKSHSSGFSLSSLTKSSSKPSKVPEQPKHADAEQPKKESGKKLKLPFFSTPDSKAESAAESSPAATKHPAEEVATRESPRPSVAVNPFTMEGNDTETVTKPGRNMSPKAEINPVPSLSASFPTFNSSLSSPPAVFDKLHPARTSQASDKVGLDMTPDRQHSPGSLERSGEGEEPTFKRIDRSASSQLVKALMGSRRGQADQSPPSTIDEEATSIQNIEVAKVEEKHVGRKDPPREPFVEPVAAEEKSGKSTRVLKKTPLVDLEAEQDVEPPKPVARKPRAQEPESHSTPDTAVPPPVPPRRIKPEDKTEVILPQTFEVVTPAADLGPLVKPPSDRVLRGVLPLPEKTAFDVEPKKSVDQNADAEFKTFSENIDDDFKIPSVPVESPFHIGKSSVAFPAVDDPSGFVDEENEYVKTSPVELFSKKSPPSSNASPTPAKTAEPFSFESISTSVKSTGHMFVADDDDDNDVKTIPVELFSKSSPPSSNTSPTPTKTEEHFSLGSISASIQSADHMSLTKTLGFGDLLQESESRYVKELSDDDDEKKCGDIKMLEPQEETVTLSTESISRIEDVSSQPKFDRERNNLLVEPTKTMSQDQSEPVKYAIETFDSKVKTPGHLEKSEKSPVNKVEDESSDLSEGFQLESVKDRQPIIEQSVANVPDIAQKSSSTSVKPLVKDSQILGLKETRNIANWQTEPTTDSIELSSHKEEMPKPLAQSKTSAAKMVLRLKSEEFDDLKEGLDPWSAEPSPPFSEKSFTKTLPSYSVEVMSSVQSSTKNRPKEDPTLSPFERPEDDVQQKKASTKSHREEAEPKPKTLRNVVEESSKPSVASRPPITEDKSPAQSLPTQKVEALVWSPTPEGGKTKGFPQASARVPLTDSKPTQPLVASCPPVPKQSPADPEANTKKTLKVLVLDEDDMDDVITATFGEKTEPAPSPAGIFSAKDNLWGGTKDQFGTSNKFPPAASSSPLSNTAACFNVSTSESSADIFPALDHKSAPKSGAAPVASEPHCESEGEAQAASVARVHLADINSRNSTPHPIKPMRIRAVELPSNSSPVAAPREPRNQGKRPAPAVPSGLLMNDKDLAMEMRESQGGQDEGPYAHLTRAELVQLLTRQQAELVDREQRIHAMEDYIDNLLVRVIEETPAILRQPERGAGRKAGRVW